MRAIVKGMKNTRGFTLIELLVVIAIIGILSSVVLASLNSARSRAQDAKRFADLRQLSSALEIYYNDVGSYPPNDPITQVNPSLNVLVPTYMSSIPADPVYTSGNGYRYCRATDGNGYTMLTQSVKHGVWCQVRAGSTDSCNWATTYPIRCGS